MRCIKTLAINNLSEKEFYPALYNAANSTSISSQKQYYWVLFSYLALLVIAAIVSFYFSTSQIGTLFSAILFMITLGLLVWLKVQKPEDIWYNGRAVAESVKTRTWRWVMKADPFDKDVAIEQVEKEFILDLKQILDQNRSLSSYLNCQPETGEAISNDMRLIRRLTLNERLDFYKQNRVNEQSLWYSKKSIYNKKRARNWFAISVVLHSTAIVMLLYRIRDPQASLPVEVIATSASAVLTWLQAKKHNELRSSYSLAAHEIVLIKGESVNVTNEKQLSDYVINSESAFSREHTQWIARKNN
jgi:hypothetical protein